MDIYDYMVRAWSVDMDKVMADVDAALAEDPAKWEKKREADQCRVDEEFKQWLSQYDDEGYLKPGIRHSYDYIPNTSLAFLDMGYEEQAAWIVSEKKRVGLL